MFGIFCYCPLYYPGQEQWTNRNPLGCTTQKSSGLCFASYDTFSVALNHLKVKCAMAGSLFCKWGSPQFPLVAIRHDGKLPSGSKRKCRSQITFTLKPNELPPSMK
jgi:hypothetical protein